MHESKRAVRDIQDDASEALRRLDGEESLGDKVDNAGDRIRHGLENAADEVHETIDDAGRKLEHERGRADERLRREVDNRS